MCRYPHFPSRLARAFVFTAGTLSVASLWAVVTIGDLAVQQTRPADDPGWDSVVSPSGASGVYLGNRWVLTAGHLAPPGGVICPAGFVASEPGSDFQLRELGGTSTTDLRMFRLVSEPQAPVAKLIDTPLPLGAAVVLVGYGSHRGDAVTYDANWVRGGTPIKYTGFEAVGLGKTWGTNRVDAIVDDDYGVGPCRVYSSSFTKPGTGSTATGAEAMVAGGDSGGAVFAKVAGQWRLAGIMTYFPDLPGQVFGTAIWGNDTWAMELAAYRPQIDALLSLTTRYGVWQYRNFRDSATSASADPDGDGFTNLEEYAYGLDPWARDPRSAAPQVALALYADGQALTVTFTRNRIATDAPPVVEVSDNLVTWTSGVGATLELPSVTLAGDVERVTVRDATPMTKAARRFLRVRVTK